MRIAKLLLPARLGHLLGSCLRRSWAAIPAGLVLTACSTHPLPEDVTGLPIHEIVHRIQCEAAETVRAVYYGKGYAAFAAEHARVAKIEKTASAELAREQKILAQNGDFGTTGSELVDARSSILLQLLHVAEAAARAVDPSRGDRDPTLVSAELDRLVQEKDELLRQLKIVKTALAALRRMDKIEKARRNASGELAGPLADFVLYTRHNVVFEFEFQVTEKNDATAGGTITWPITLGSIKLAYNAGDSKKRMGKRNVKVLSSFSDLIDEEKHNCWDVDLADDRRLPRRYPITGKIVMEEVIANYLRISSVKGHKFVTPDTKSYTDTITFTTTLSAGINPSISLTRRMGQLIDANVDLDVSREDIHTATIFLTPPSSTKADEPKDLIIKQMPAIRTRTSIVRQPPAG
jgi:hypothetical protein